MASTMGSVNIGRAGETNDPPRAHAVGVFDDLYSEKIAVLHRVRDAVQGFRRQGRRRDRWAAVRRER